MAGAPNLTDLGRRMDGAIGQLKTELASLRTGRAASSMLDPVMVDAYGSSVPINQCGTISIPEPRMIVINVWDRGLINAVDKAIRNSGLGVNPVVDGPFIRIPIPELNEERRKELTKVAGKYAEAARVAIRNIRRDGIDQSKKAQKHGLSEDEAKILSDKIQKLTDDKIAEVDRMQAAKEKEILQI